MALAAASPMLSAGGASAGSADALPNFLPAALKPPFGLKPVTTPAATFEPRSFGDIRGWDGDDHLAAWTAFLASCKPVLGAARSGAKSGARPTPQALLDVCSFALAQDKSTLRQTRAGARAFFEQHFTPHAVSHANSEGLLTGYYEPVVKGSRTPDANYTVPVYRRPADLVNVVAESERGATSHQFTHLRDAAQGLIPHLTRAAIEQGGLNGQNLELMYFKDPVDVFFMQIQGSARIELPSGEKIRITYDGKNGYPYTSIGKALIELGSIKPENMSLKSLSAWLKADRARAEPIMWKNESYVFFRELKGAEADSAMGVLNIPLQAGRSLAVDTGFHSIGTPIFVSAPTLTHPAKGDGFHRLMIAQDVGSAIKGPERGDIYFGSGDAAGRIAGVTKHAGNFFVLLPREAALAHVGADAAP